MPTPIFHSAFAVASARLAAKQDISWRTAALFVVVACLPDLDLIPGLLAGVPLKYHHCSSHSIVTAALSALLFSFVPFSGPREASYWRRLRFIFLASISHPLLDLFTRDEAGLVRGMVPGLPLAWPFSAARLGPLYGFFPDTVFTQYWRDWLLPQNLKAFARESLCGAAVIGLSWLATSRVLSPKGAPRASADAAG